MNKIINVIFITGFFLFFSLGLHAQEPLNVVGKLKSLTKKGDYAILQEITKELSFC